MILSQVFPENGLFEDEGDLEREEKVGKCGGDGERGKRWGDGERQLMDVKFFRLSSSTTSIFFFCSKFDFNETGNFSGLIIGIALKLKIGVSRELTGNADGRLEEKESLVKN
jgi:hypothetical protein